MTKAAVRGTSQAHQQKFKFALYTPVKMQEIGKTTYAAETHQQLPRRLIRRRLLCWQTHQGQGPHSSRLATRRVAAAAHRQVARLDVHARDSKVETIDRGSRAIYYAVDPRSESRDPRINAREPLGCTAIPPRDNANLRQRTEPC
eukprot:2235980-Rhodomonas_salina.4